MLNIQVSFTTKMINVKDFKLHTSTVQFWSQQPETVLSGRLRLQQNRCLIDGLPHFLLPHWLTITGVCPNQQGGVSAPSPLPRDHHLLDLGRETGQGAAAGSPA